MPSGPVNGPKGGKPGSTDDRYDAIVIGAGMSGLAAGIRLAQFDRRVLILERHELWGGLNSFYTLGGRRFDVGLHALTNFVPPRTKGTALTRVLRQLRLRHEDWKLGEQGLSEILFPDLRLTFTNDIGHLQAEVERAFPADRDSFAKLLRDLFEYDVSRTDHPRTTARQVLAETLRTPLLREALLLAPIYYGSAHEDDLDWHSFAVLFRGIFLEGLARPQGGIRTILNLLIKRYKHSGGELRMRSGVARVLVDEGRARGVELDDGTILTADRVFSSAGWVETMRMCGEPLARAYQTEAATGRISFVESMSVLDCLPHEIGHEAATSFFCNGERLNYRVPEGLADVSSGVISAPSNFAGYEHTEGLMRLTFLANHDRWSELSEEAYKREKERWADAAVAAVAGMSQHTPDWRPNTVFRDVFTPRTVRRFTGHVNGAIYGSPEKHWDGTTPVQDLILCGTDQGYVGIVGALMSGIMMANDHALAEVVR